MKMLKKYVNGLLPVSSIRYPDLFIQIKAMLFPAGKSLCSQDKDPHPGIGISSYDQDQSIKQPGIEN
jgi:hypothetical protein